MKWGTSTRWRAPTWKRLQLADATAGSLVAPGYDPSGSFVSSSEDSTGTTFTLDDTAAAAYMDQGPSWAFKLRDYEGRFVDFSQQLRMNIQFRVRAVTSPGASSDFWITVGVGDGPEPASSNGGFGAGYHYTGGSTPFIYQTRLSPTSLLPTAITSTYDDTIQGEVLVTPALVTDASRLQQVHAYSHHAAGNYADGNRLGYSVSFASANLTGDAHLYVAVGRSATGGGNATGKFIMEYLPSTYLLSK